MRPRLDRPHRPFRPRCLVLGMVLAWIVASYLPAFLIAAAGHAGSGSPLAAMWLMTDRVAIAVKLALGALFVAFLVGSRKLVTLPPAIRAAADAALGALAMLLLLAFLPEAWSRGFGIGLTGARFDPATLPWYLIGSAVAGLAFSLADAKCGELSYGRPADEA